MQIKKSSVVGVWIFSGTTQCYHTRENVHEPFIVNWTKLRCAPVAQLVEHRAAMQEVVSSTPAGPTIGVFK